MANDNQNNNNQNNNQSNNEQVLTDIILKASSYMDNSSFDSALNTIQNGLSISPDNYELIFMSALCYEQINEIEAAYYRYRLAIYLSARDTGDSSDDTALIKNELNRMCEYTNADKYKLAVSLEQLILERIHLKEYNSTFYFLKSVLYDVNHTASRIVMTEGNAGF
jgi:tetratricopeptide (TPR) repeat protein